MLEAQGTRLGPLGELSLSEARTLVNQIVGDSQQFRSDVERTILLSKTGGIPLFVEELTKTVLEGNVPASNADDLRTCCPPSTASPLHCVVHWLPRLDRLKVAKPLAQIVATLGRVFDEEVLSAVTGESQGGTHAINLAQTAKDFLQQHGLLAQAKYSFRHALIQDAADHLLLKSERQAVAS